MELFAVAVNRDDTVRVVAVPVVKETPMFYFIDPPDNEDRYVLGYGRRIDKAGAHTTAVAALDAYMEQRRRHKEAAREVVAQATKQIASANELRMALDGVSVADGARALPES